MTLHPKIEFILHNPNISYETLDIKKQYDKLQADIQKQQFILDQKKNELLEFEQNPIQIKAKDLSKMPLIPFIGIIIGLCACVLYFFTENSTIGNFSFGCTVISILFFALFTVIFVD